jgi:hypothetical protein
MEKYKKDKNIKKVSSINLDEIHLSLLKRLGLNLSMLVRDLLDSFFKSNYPDEYLEERKKIKDKREVENEK